MEREPDIGALRALALIAETGSISAASSVLGLSQQAASLRVRSLEQELGVPLLVRSARGSRLTEAGELVVGWACLVLDAANGFGAAVAALREGQGNSLRIAASLTIAEHLLPGWIARWRGLQGPSGATATLTAANSSAVIASLRSGDVDLGFVETPELPSDLSAATVGRDRIEVVVAASHPWAGRTVSPAELAATPMVHRERGSGTRLAFERALAAAGHPLEAEPAAVHETTLGARSAVMAGVAPGALSVLAVRDDIRGGRLARVAVAGLEITRPLTALWRGADPTAAAQELLQEIAESQGA
ncbi:DNA-binding transcriptional LysR family regulator [Leucobacter komagatae]|uniref:DNA-binding transcriptional LysR family regulator n=1 Tax=Leucobacter komagatae TaxID=55969 RepID=A0A542Y9B5_9MICO|nr:LysR family transcriptional regulator [Leucobacter komagatae]TQL44678.1 DNA-binding transcriptional LysR family regulator [Leucobacter komagatae]